MVIAPPQSLGRSEIFRLVKELEVEFIAHIGALSEKLSGFLFPLTVLRREPHCQRGDPFFRSVFNELPRLWLQRKAIVLRTVGK
jgi:hypothetical protein